MDNREKELIENLAVVNDISFDEVHNLVENMKQTIVDVWDELKEIVNTIVDDLTDIDYRERHRNTWIVPMDMTKPPQIPKMPNIAMPRIRSHI